MANWLDGPVFRILETGMHASDIRQKVIANNIANVDTPHFKRSDVDFETVFNSLFAEKNLLNLKMTSPRHIPGLLRAGGSVIVTDDKLILRLDGNNVDIDREMTNAAENGYYHNMLVQAYSSQLGYLRSVITSR